MKQLELMLPEGSLYYELREGPGAAAGGMMQASAVQEVSLQQTEAQREIFITGMSGSFGVLRVPEQIDGIPVTGIGRKAFLSRKLLREVLLPESLKTIEDWAFAYCSGLERAVLPDRELTIGRSVFLECGKLRRIEVAGRPDMAELMAAAVTFFEAYYLIDPLHAGEREWLAKWDNRLLAFLRTDDREGYAKQVLCGEEDYGSTDLEAFLNGRRRNKARLSFLRLLNPCGLSETVAEELRQYLSDHTKGCDSAEAWEVVLEEHGTERRYYELFADLCLRQDNFDAVLNDIPEDCPEMKAYFLRRKQEQIGYTDFFDSLSLDL